MTAGSASIAGSPPGPSCPGERRRLQLDRVRGDISSYTYQWLLGGKVLAGATHGSLQIAFADTGLALTCRVTAVGATRVGER